AGPWSAGSGKSGPRSHTISAAVRSASVAVMSRTLPTTSMRQEERPTRKSAGGTRSQLVVHHQCASGETGSLEEVLRVAGAGKCIRVDSHAMCSGAELDHQIGNRLA